MIGLMVLGGIGCASKDTGDIAILYTNDVHIYVDGPISYDVIAAIKEELQTKFITKLMAR